MMAGVMKITLERDGQSQPWGFRLQGGSDLNTPLLVQRVLVGTPTDGYLKRGDQIISIENFDSKKLTHQQAADMFENAGNTITITIKRASNPVTKQSTSFSTKTIVSNFKSHDSYGSSLSRSATLPKNFMRTSVLQKSTTVGNLPVKAKGTGTTQNLSSTLPKPTPIPISPIPTQVVKPTMKKSLPVSYNSPINLYSSQNVAEVAQLNREGQMPIPSMNRIITPNKPQQIILNPKKDYNPQESATWRALQEDNDMPLVDPARVQSYSSLKEHEPIYSAVYSAPKMNSPQVPKPGPRINSPIPQSPVRSPLPGATRSPVADLLPSSYGASAKTSHQQQPPAHENSEVQKATLVESSYSPSPMANDERIPIYETTSIGGKKRITQSASFNKLMMDVLGV